MKLAWWVALAICLLGFIVTAITGPKWAAISFAVVIGVLVILMAGTIILVLFLLDTGKFG